MKQTIFGVALFALLIFPPVADALESIMITHMLVQLPLLIFSGWLIGCNLLQKFSSFFDKWNVNGVPGILLVVIITTYWMIPRTLDEALVVWYVELFKFISLPFMVGIVLHDSWNKLGALGRSFIIFNYISMFGLMAWLYIDAPVRICNNYLEVEQKMLGWGFLVITAGIVLYMIQQVFTEGSEHVKY